jgi:hypothetical protein
MLYQLSYFRPILGLPSGAECFGAESQIRTGDTAIFSRVLYQLSYLGPAAQSKHYTTSWRIRTSTSDEPFGQVGGLRNLHRRTPLGNVCAC